MIASTRLVCTVLIGGYEELTEQPIAADSDVEFVCFTDDPGLSSRTWSVRQIDPLFAMDPVRSARDVKIRLGRHVGSVDETLWIDNSVRLLRRPEEILAEWLAGWDLAMPRHSFRGTVIDEFAEVARSGLDDASRIYEQAGHYRVVDPDVLTGPVLWTGMIARRTGGAQLADFEALWMDHVLRYSRRDQLSVNYALRASGAQCSVIEMDDHVSALHRWPVSQGREAGAERRIYRAALIHDDVEGSRREARQRSMDQERSMLLDRVRSLEEERDHLVADVARREAELTSRDAELASQQGILVDDAELCRLQRAEQDLAMVLGSRSFRLTSGPRRVAAAVRSGTGRPGA